MAIHIQRQTAAVVDPHDVPPGIQIDGRGIKDLAVDTACIHGDRTPAGSPHADIVSAVHKILPLLEDHTGVIGRHLVFQPEPDRKRDGSRHVRRQGRTDRDFVVITVKRVRR